MQRIPTKVEVLSKTFDVEDYLKYSKAEEWYAGLTKEVHRCPTALTLAFWSAKEGNRRYRWMPYNRS